MAKNVIDIIVDGTDRVSSVFKRIGNTAERAFDQAERAFSRLENEMRSVPDIDVDTSKAMTEVAALQARLEKLERDEIEIKIRTDTSMLLPSILALGPTIAPVLATTSAAIMGLATAFATAGIGALAFGAVAVSVLRRVFEETDNLSAKEQEARKALEGFQSFWSRFTASFQTPILDMFIKSLGMLQTALTGLKPVFSASITAFASLLEQLDASIKSSQMQTFFQWLSKNVGPAIQAFGAIFGNVMVGVMNLMMAFGPMATDMQNGLVNLTQRFAEWTAGLSKSQSFKEFIAYVQANGPVLMSVLGQTATLLLNLVKAMAPLGQTLLKGIDNLLKFTNQLLTTHPAVGQVAIAIGVLVGAVKLLATPIMAVVGFVSRLVPYLTKAGTAVMNFAKQFRSLSTISIGGWVVAAVGFLLLLYNTSKQFADFVNNTFRGVWESLQATFSNFSASLEPLQASFSALGATLSQLWTKLEPLAVTLGTVLVVAVVAAIAIINGLLNALAPLIGVIINVVTTVVSLVSAFVSLLTLGFVGFLESINGFVEAFVSILMGITDTVVALFSGMWSMVVQIFAQFGVNLVAMVTQFFTSIGTAIMTATNAALSWLVARYNSAKAAVASSLSSLGSAVSSIFSTLSSVIRSYTSSAVSFATSRFQALRTQAVSAFNSARAAISNAMSSIANAVRNGFSRAVSAVSSAGSRIRSTLSSLASSAFSWGANLAGMFASGISSRISAAVSAARSAAAKIKSYLGFSSPTEKGPGKDADKWAPNLMSMFADGIKAGIPKLETSSSSATATLGASLNPSPTLSSGTSATTNKNYTINIYEANDRPTERTVIDALRRAEWLYG